MNLVDIHCHMLCGVDDGAKNEGEMLRMIDCAYKRGVRVICMTPHYNPAYFRCPLEVTKDHFEKSRRLVGEKYPDVKLLLGQEIYYYHDTVDDLLSGRCLSLNGTRNVLVEFGPYDDKTAIFSGVSRILTSGYIPLIAHVERYSSLGKSKQYISDLRKQGAKIQVNASSVIGKNGFVIKFFVNSLIRRGLVDVVADDCHGDRVKAPCLDEAYAAVQKKFGQRTADELFVNGPLRLLQADSHNR